MSEKNNLNASHFCTTEDAFEKFQAESMYEEDEFITLSDIVPSQNQAPDLMSEICDIPYEDEVVLESICEEQVHEVNSTNESGFDENKMSGPCDQPYSTSEVIAAGQVGIAEPGHNDFSDAGHVDVLDAGLVDTSEVSHYEEVTAELSAETGKNEPGYREVTEETVKPRSRRGRKKKCLDSSELVNENNDTSADVSLSVQKQNEVLSPPATRRRGRPPKNVSKKEVDVPVSPEDLPAYNSDQNNSVRKRGRPKKVNPELQISDTESNAGKNNENVTSTSEKLIPNALTQKRVKRKRLPSIEKSENDLNESALQAEDCNLNLDQNITNPNQPNKKSPGKRGRPKKSEANNVEQQIKPTLMNFEGDKGDDDTDDICLSKLKTSKEGEVSVVNDVNICEESKQSAVSEVNEIQMELEMTEGNGIIFDESQKTNSNITDFELKIDTITSENTENKETSEILPQDNADTNNSLLVEDTSKRPTRRRARKPLHYDEESDEDPFANVELSDDEPIGCSKRKNYSDDEYIPGKNSNGKRTESSDSDSEIELDNIKDELIENKRKRPCKKSEGSPTKGAKKGSIKSVQEITSNAVPDNVVPKPESGMDDDIEVCLKPSIIKTNDDKKNKDIESFLAKKIQGTDIQIKKKSTVQPFEIPVIDPNERKKTTENFTQTKKVATTSASVQTAVVYDIPMKENVTLTTKQSEKACEFLNSIVKTTAELGELMTQKSEDFIKKKINTSHVTDTFKMDYCVRKSFLLFKLAKHNLMQMEDDLAKQYDDFLNAHNLQKHREQPKVLTAAPKEGSDSDCEIIETPVVQKPQKKKAAPAFNPKTVFLNKELSIKIAKKTPAKDTKPDTKQINIKGRHTVWINDSIMVKKVKPTQSFLAQDSRNKKPPDYVTIEMVNSFFKQYYREQAIAACAPYVSPQWLTQSQESICCYFSTNADDISVTTGIPNASGHCITESNSSESNSVICDSTTESHEKFSPKSLFTLCTQVLQSHLHNAKSSVNKTSVLESPTSKISEFNPHTLYGLCINIINIANVAREENSKDLIDEQSIYEAESASMSLDKAIDYEYADCESSSSLLDKGEFEEADWEYPFTPNVTVLDQDESYKLTESVPKLKTLCHQQILKQMFPDSFTVKEKIPACTKISDSFNLNNEDKLQTIILDEQYLKYEYKNGVKSLFSICFDLLRSHMSSDDKLSKHIAQATAKKAMFMPRSLKCLTFKCIVDLIYNNKASQVMNGIILPNKVKTLSDLCFDLVTKVFSGNTNEELNHKGLTINSINTLTEEAFHNIDESELAEDYYEDDNSNFYDDETESEFTNNLENESNVDNKWLSQVQMKVLRSCYTPVLPPETDSNAQEEQLTNDLVEAQPLVTRIKTEPLDEFQDHIDTSVVVKSEPLGHSPDEMTIIPENVVTKTEYLDAPNTSPRTSRVPQRQNSNSYDVDTFEAFVSSNKMMHSLNETYSNDEGEIYSQSASRIRRQFEPDDLSENDMGMSLLVPQTFEPLHIENNAKNCLMESSSDESTNSKKVTGKKKPEKRSRTRPKKNDNKPGPNKGPIIVPPKEKAQPTNEIAILTRRMRDKIRQEEKKVVSSESENENENILSIKDKIKQKEEKNKSKHSKTTEKVKDVQTPDEGQNTKTNDEIQCSNVDSTEQINEVRNASPSISNFSGFSAVDQNEISSYHKYVKYVYDQILPKVDQTESQTNQGEPIINPEEPVELLECEPTMPFFSEPPPGLKRRPGPKTKTQNITSGKEILQKDAKEIKPNDDKCIERHGWKCYPLDSSDTKLYQNAQIVLEKLPESFVQTYFTYQDIASKNEEDDEVDRLINLQTLNRLSTKEGKVSKGKSKGKILDNSSEPGCSSNLDSGMMSPTFSDAADELTPSEDEGDRVDDEVPSVSKPTSDNHLAKSSLMDDEDSDGNESGIPKIKGEPLDEHDKLESSKSKKSKSKTKAGEEVPTGPVMLTADKMMNKELNLLHAPINLDNNVEPAPSKSRPSRNKQKSSSKTSSKEHNKDDDESSSEEEKHQWFTIKEKLLKRMVKKSDTTREDDAKRAKLVSEFITRRGDSSEAYIKRRGGRGRRVSKKKMLERQKQLKVLTRELFGDPSNDASLHPKRQQAAYFKGRRNIRKVIDKKSLARSTVVANMEEFERKRRINIRQNKLRDIMQCEDGVNVLVINDEVCLEYDFEANRPVVTIHPFFTKVMKAHQYEGVKFMWDACFESLEAIAAGSAGGGCILAHCMGLGKTLQVLALLHTVLTHPRVGMQRVLVCCPLSTVLNWVDEIHKWIGPVTNQIKPAKLRRKLQVFELSKLKKTSNRAYQLEDWYNGGGIFIIGYELFRSLTTLDPFLDDVRPAIVNKIRTALLDPGPDIIICDEGHLLKNDCSVLAVAMSRVVTKRRIVLTGTPMQNNLREYYCMVNFVKPNLLGTYSEYSNRFENPIMNGQHRDSREEDIKLMKARTHILHKVLEGCLQRQEASVLYPYLPKKHEYTVFISLTKCQWDLYKHYLKNYSNTQNNKSILKDFHILQKIWSHPQVLHNFQNRTGETTRNKVKEEKCEDDLASEDLHASEDIKPTDTEIWWLQYLEEGAMLDSLASSNKFVAVFRILEESIALQDKVLIFSTSLFTMDVLEYFLKKINKWSLGQEYYRLDGSVPAEVRQKWCREFNAEHNHKTKLFLISTRAGSLGLNMTAANRVIILDTSWNPAHDIQSIFRVYRFGQKKDCYIYRLVAMGTMEQKIYERSVTKQAVACRVVDEQLIDRHYNMAELTELYKYDETGVGVAGGVAVGVEDVVLLRVARDAALHAVHEHDSLLRGSLEQGLPEHERDAAWVQFQEEHARKQEMQQLEPKPQPVKIKKVKVKVPTSIAECAKTEPGGIKTETDESILPNDPEFLAETSRPKAKGKKGRPTKNSVVNCCIPIQPEAPEPEQTLDESMVQKITHILIQHNYQNNQGPREIADLVARVRTLVHGGHFDQLDEGDQLTMSIARVLLGREPAAPMTPLTDINEPESHGLGEPSAVKQENIEPPRPRGKGRPRKGKSPEKMRKGYVYEEVPSTSAQPEPQPETDGRTRRRAALAAEKNFDSAGVAVIDIDDDDWRDDEFFPEVPIRHAPNDEGSNDLTYSSETFPYSENDANARPPPQSKFNTLEHTASILDKFNIKQDRDAYDPPATKSSANSKSKKKGTPMYTDLQTLNLDEQSSIVLSDDEDSAPLASAPKRKPGPARRKTASVESPAASTSKDAEKGSVPLHPSLLSNKNFIKIVAHTYLSGNPMLDEDAATLAAQYSTFKALKEYEANEKSIDSGPIYDIAVKVLGVEVLRKLHKSNLKMSTSEMLAQHPISSQETAAAKDTSANSALKLAFNADKKTPTPVTKSKPGPASAKKLPIQNTAAESTTVSSQPVETNVTAKRPPVKIKVKLRPGRFNPDALCSPVPVPAVPAVPTGNVVPVGLFQRAAEVPSGETPTADECILPDDDDIRIVTDPVLAPAPVHLAPAPAPVHLAPAPAPVHLAPAGLGLQPLPPLAPAPAPGRRQTIVVKSLDRHSFPLTTVYASQPAAPDLAGPISLDSDDEERPPAAPRRAPVPVGLTAVRPDSVPPQIRSACRPRVLRRVPAGSVFNSTFNADSGPSDALPKGAQFVLVPASGFAQPPPVVPVALSKVHYNAQGAPQPNITSLEAPIVISDDILNSASVSTAVVEQPPVEAPVPEPRSEVVTKKPLKRKCRPGDILRITEGGEIEVLNRKDLTSLPTVALQPPPSAGKASPAPSKASPASKAPPAPSKAPPAPSKAPPAAPVQNRTLRGSSQLPKHPPETKVPPAKDISRGITRSPSPSDIFKNVVHIEACDYASRQAADTDAPANRKVITINIPANERNRKSEKVTIAAKASASIVKPPVSNSKATPQKSKAKDKILDSVDLTDVDFPPVSIKKPEEISKKKTTPSKPTTVVGTSKSIILCSTGKAISKAAVTPKPTTTAKPAQKAAEKSTPAPKQELKKRPAPVDNSLAKKKKTDKPMTLKDFNLDDIDDIIELD
ncbi:uncharacterized protein LOC114354895 isoform X2 [Ostrinia furnacalis]|uniref:uncharacterized protein LOC114354895 isoform X2 n=1 Tax=Ostrinia furnacalis TaxID=93504 RepID=UPI00104095C6|nr:uncharacterized protein LOC114354895 isoform X2 [Ostrinia furnacalis]